MHTNHARQLLGAWVPTLLVSLLPFAPLHAQTAPRAALGDGRSGQELYRSSCAACHGSDGKGAAQSATGFESPLPDFTDCSFATPEQDADWLAIVHDGGPVRAFDRMMPAFGEALAEADLHRIIQYVRLFCSSRAWPRGELNLPRPLVTEKAFPENEAVFSTSVTGGDERAIGGELLYERRFGARNQFEIAVPLGWQKSGAGPWQHGLGDVAVAVKRVLFHSLDRGSIVSAGAEAVLPTGKEEAGLGKGVTIFEPFVVVGQILPANGFAQVQAGVEFPTDRARAEREAFWRVAAGKTLVEGRFGRAWSPMVELLAARELARGEETLWDIVPQLQISLSRRQHILMNGGVRIPLNERGARRPEALAYLLWDWFDGGFFEGWR
jgi:hypothetical protein